MSQNPYQSPSMPATAVGVNSGTREDLKKVAQYQKGIMYCILANFVMIAVLIFAGQSVAPGAGKTSLMLIMNGLYIIVALAQLVFIVMLATKVYNMAIGVIAGILSFIPCLGLIILLVVNQKATKVLQQNGIKVGLMGANMSQLA